MLEFDVNDEKIESTGDIKALFDGYCNLCSRSVTFANSKTKNVEFLSLQSEEGKKIIGSKDLNNELNTFILVKDSEVFIRSNAVLELIKEFGGSWKFLSNILLLIPRGFRDRIYRFVSNHRFVLFDKRKKCFNLKKAE
jgi:predicted DCC family thiol-disulfide oxidoreductase YuxK